MVQKANYQYLKDHGSVLWNFCFSKYEVAFISPPPQQKEGKGKGKGREKGKGKGREEEGREGLKQTNKLDLACMSLCIYF